MIYSTQKKLRPNPFETYRDPITGRWVVVKKENSQVPNQKMLDYLVM